MRLSFLGAAGEVTGSCFLVDTGAVRFLVDCGLFQGGRDAGHILGSASIEITLDTPRGSRRIVFSGDLGQPGHPIVRDPTPVTQADVLVVEESIALNRIHHGAVIISASGMCEAGRIKYHLKRNLPRPECAILITGFQAAGTLGRRLVDGARRVRIFGDEVAVKARIHTIGGLSAHADQAGLLAWLAHFQRPPAATYIVHGEATAATAFQEAIAARLGWNASIPGPGSVESLFS